MPVPNYRATTLQPYNPPYQKFYPVEYFSAVDVSLFFDQEDGTEPIYIDEVTELQFTVTEKAQPVYGYANYTANRIIKGARIVNGMFTINMRPGDYLHELVNNAAQVIQNSTAPAAGLAEYAKPNPITDPDGFAAWQGQQRATYWDALEALAEPAAQGSDLIQTPYFTNNGFKIVLIFGDVDTVDISRNAGRVRTIDGVNLFSVGSGINMSGEAICETFNFIAVDINRDNRLTPFL